MFTWFHKGPRQHDFDDELEYHLAMLAREDPIGPGPHQVPSRKLGNRTLIEEALCEMWTLSWLEALGRDLRYALRALRSQPGFTAAAVLSLALGIGANTALFQLVDALVLRALPIPNAQNLARLDYVGQASRSGDIWQAPNDFTNPQWEQIRASHAVFSGVLAWGTSPFNLARRGEVRFASGLFVSGSFFRVLEISPEIGRLFSDRDDVRGCPSTAVISNAFWHSEFGAEPSAVGRKLLLNGQSFQIIGVSASGFEGLDVGKRFDVAVPLCSEPLLARENTLDARATWWLSIMGRLRPGVSFQQASAYLGSVWPRIIQSTIDPTWRPDVLKDYLRLQIRAEPGRTGFSTLRKQVEDPLLLLLAIAGLVLLIACTNLANLSLARAAMREGEIGVRLAIGASRGRIVRQLLSESLVLALLGSAAGIILARILSGYLLVSFAASKNPLFLNLNPDWRTFAFVAALVTLGCLLFGLVPAWRATDRDLNTVVKASRRWSAAGRPHFGLQQLFVVSQISLSLILLVGSLLFVRSFYNLMTLDSGFRQRGLVAIWVTLDEETLPKAQYPPLFERMLDRLRSLPGIDEAASVSHPPIGGSYSSDWLTMDGADSKQAANVLCNYNRVGDGYFRTLGTALLAGRDFTPHDNASAAPVAIVDEMFVKQFLGGADPLGKTFHPEASPGASVPHFQIVGVVRNSKYADLQTPLSPTVFLAKNQDPNPGPYTRFVIHSNLPLAATLTAARDALLEVNPHTTIDFHPMPALIDDSVRRERVLARLSGVFALLAIILATVGLYGVISYIVAHRRGEIGIRVAVGATGFQILQLVFRQSIGLLFAGVCIGTVLALAGTRVARSLLFGVSPQDPAIVAGAILALTVVSLIATVVPAWSAVRLDPVTALREE
ncbi:MAG TPA: ABC transporter permease [Bryobacteraceae bacterium]|nr:ABC transporter permease [Bryobacteraceae bacterium]